MRVLPLCLEIRWCSLSGDRIITAVALGQLILCTHGGNEHGKWWHHCSSGLDSRIHQASMRQLHLYLRYYTVITAFVFVCFNCFECSVFRGKSMGGFFYCSCADTEWTLRLWMNSKTVSLWRRRVDALAPVAKTVSLRRRHVDALAPVAEIVYSL